MVDFQNHTRYNLLPYFGKLVCSWKRLQEWLIWYWFSRTCRRFEDNQNFFIKKKRKVSMIIKRRLLQWKIQVWEKDRMRQKYQMENLLPKNQYCKFVHHHSWNYYALSWLPKQDPFWAERRTIFSLDFFLLSLLAAHNLFLAPYLLINQENNRHTTVAHSSSHWQKVETTESFTSDCAVYWWKIPNK